jgi:uncharacterized metal-binding protein
MSKKQSCACDGSLKLIFPCSGGSDVGEIADRAARKMSEDGIGKVYCLAGIGGQVSGIVESTKAADKILVIDGCPLDCAKKMLEHAGFKKFKHLRVTDLGMKKGASPASTKHVAKVAQEGAKLLI